MKRFVFLTVLCCLVLGMRAQTAKEEIFADAVAASHVLIESDWNLK